MTLLAKLQRLLRKGLSPSLLAFLLAAPCAGAAEDAILTTSLRTKEGLFAVRLDPESKQLYFLRADQRGGSLAVLKVKLLTGDPVGETIELRRINKEESPERYVGKVRQWPKALRGFILLMPAPGGSWKEIGRSEEFGHSEGT